jgi:Met-zincin/Domain of unknown function (DUF5117)
MNLFKRFFLLLCFALSIDLIAQTPAPNPIEVATKDLEKKDGFLPFYWDTKKGKILLEIKQFDKELLYYPTLAQGIGSNDIGLDRGRLGQEHVVKFQRTGNKILMIEPNYGYRALSNDPLERRAVEESFAQSALWGFEVIAEHEGRVLIDLTPFLMQDAVGAVQGISRTRQGNFKFDASRSMVYLPNTKNFPQNTEFEITTTFTGEGAGAYLQAVVPSPSAITIRQHHSFVQLPELGDYQPRAFDPRIGYNQVSFFDYASPISDPIAKKYITRHRLKKKDPTAALSEPVKPIVYYIDPGAPEPIRSALTEGAKWWNQAFEAAGYKDAFQVKLLPADADPMDVRYNLVQWVHRSTRGWSYGMSINDPRTGEILKGKVTLGSLRVRQDYMIAQGLVGDFDAANTREDEMLQMSADRLKQLSAHEIGHTLGLPHNYVSSIHNRASVMDYPHMVAALKQGKIDLSDAYAKGIGEYDKWSIVYGYQDFAPGVDEKKGLENIVAQMQAKGLLFLSDQDARPEGSVHPQTHLWDNGSNATAELERVMEVRKTVLSNFDARKIKAGVPMANLEEVFVPMFMFHRFQVEAASKAVAGVNYRYSVKGEKDLNITPVSAAEQRKALNVLLQTLQPNFLKVPEAVLQLVPPRAYGFEANPRETFKRRTGLAFDALAPAEASAGLTLRMLLNPERINRLAVQQTRDASLPNLKEVVEQLLNSTWQNKPSADAYEAVIQRTIQKMTLVQLIDLTRNKDISSEAQAVIMKMLNTYGFWKNVSVAKVMTNPKTSTMNEHFDWVTRQLKIMNDSIENLSNTTTLTPPDGQPIDPDYDWLVPACGWER